MTQLFPLVTLAIVERLAAFASALAWHTSWFSKFAVGFGVIAVVHRALRMTAKTGAIGAVFGRIVARLSEDYSTVGAAGDAIGIVDAGYQAVRAVVDVGVAFIADWVAALVGITLVVVTIRGDTRIFCTLVVFGVVVGIVSLLAQPSTSAFDKHTAMMNCVADAVDGRTEVVASGQHTTYGDRFRVIVGEWQTAVRFDAVRAFKTSRWPLIFVGAGILVALSRGQAEFRVRDVLFFFVAVTPWLGLVRGIHELSKIGAHLQPLVPLFDHRPTQWKGTASPRAVDIRWNDVSIIYGERVVVSNVTFQVPRGQIVALAGRNGAGKTSLLLVALGLVRPNRGSFAVGNVPVEGIELDAWRRRVSYLPQRPYLLPRRSVRSCMLFPGFTFDDGTIEQALRDTHLWDRLAAKGDTFSTMIDELSVGERQRLAIARALCRDADVYLLDEPDANLDADGLVVVVDLLRKLAARNKVVVVAAHTPQVLLAADSVVDLNVRSLGDT